MEDKSATSIAWTISLDTRISAGTIGNAGYQQLRLDIYGEMMDSIYLANKYGDAISYGRLE